VCEKLAILQYNSALKGLKGVTFIRAEGQGLLLKAMGRHPPSTSEGRRLKPDCFLSKTGFFRGRGDLGLKRGTFFVQKRRARVAAQSYEYQ